MRTSLLRAAMFLTAGSVAFGIGLCATGTDAPTAWADATGDEPAKEEPARKPKYSVEATDVYYGRHSSFAKPAEVDLERVYAEIEEYQRIRKEGLAETDPQYEILVSKATRRFNSALRKAAKALGYDLIAKTGSVSGGEEAVPDITQEVVDRL